MLRRVASLAVIALAAVALPQSELVGKDQFPSFRAMAALPGSSFPVNHFGRPDPRGAMALSTPIGYALGGWHVALGFGSRSNDMSLAIDFDDNAALRDADGTGQVMLGIPLRQYGTLTASGMLLSSFKDTAFNFQYQPPNQELNPVIFSVGVQDLRGNGGSSGEDIEGDEDTSTSFYGVGTWRVKDGFHVSLGAGSRRFEPVFGNVSYSLTRELKATLEYDAFNWNYGLAYTIPLKRPPTIQDFYEEYPAEPGATIHAGVIRGKYLYASLVFAF